MSRPAERSYSGTVASAGIASGTIWRPRRADLTSRSAGTPAEEQAALAAAIAAAAEQLQALADRVDEEGRAVLQFQLALLADPELCAPAFVAMAAGRSAAEAWGEALDAEIATYEAGEDEYFAARATDLRDLRDRVLRALAAAEDGDGEAAADSILLDEDLTPSRFLEIDWRAFRGAALLGGSAAGHVSILARARGVPLLTGVALPGGVLGEVPPAGAHAIVDAEQGRLILNPSDATAADYRRRISVRAARQRDEAAYLGRAAVTSDGERIKVYVNVDDPALVGGIDPAHCDGVGLTRTEFLFRSGLPDEATQYQAYAALLAWGAGRPITIRTLDAGGDKPIPGLTPDGEANPFLGVRGLRLSLARRDVFMVQLRALARAAVKGPLRVMVPMVSVPQELAEARALMEQAVADLGREGQEAAMPAFGMMVEVPSAALAVADFRSDFLSIGTNDLIQYTLAASRDSGALSHLRDSRNPAVLELIARVARHGGATGIEVSVCGDMAGEVESLEALLAAGVRALSVAPAGLASVKAALARLAAA